MVLGIGGGAASEASAPCAGGGSLDSTGVLYRETLMIESPERLYATLLNKYHHKMKLWYLGVPKPTPFVSMC